MKYIIIAIMIIATSFDVSSGGKPKPQIKIVHVQQSECPNGECDNE